MKTTPLFAKELRHRLAFREDSGILRLELRGHLDVSTVGSVMEELRSFRGRKDVRRIQVAARGAGRSFDSGVVGLFVVLCQLTPGRALEIRGLPAPLVTLLKEVGLSLMDADEANVAAS